MLFEMWIMMIGHWIADFVCQTHWQATNKSKNWMTLSSHVAIYTAIMTVFFIALVPPSSQAVLLFVGATFVSHFMTDAITSRITSYLWAKQKVHDFFVVVGFDQLIHLSTIMATLIWLL